MAFDTYGRTSDSGGAPSALTPSSVLMLAGVQKEEKYYNY